MNNLDGYCNVDFWLDSSDSLQKCALNIRQAYMDGDISESEFVSLCKRLKDLTHAIENDTTSSS
jgi:hypothetical protein